LYVKFCAMLTSLGIIRFVAVVQELSNEIGICGWSIEALGNQTKYYPCPAISEL